MKSSGADRPVVGRVCFWGLFKRARIISPPNSHGLRTLLNGQQKWMSCRRRHQAPPPPPPEDFRLAHRTVPCRAILFPSRRPPSGPSALPSCWSGCHPSVPELRSPSCCCSAPPLPQHGLIHPPFFEQVIFLESCKECGKRACFPPLTFLMTAPSPSHSAFKSLPRCKCVEL